MNLAIDIALWTIVLALGLTLFLRDQPMFADSLRFARREFFAMISAADPLRRNQQVGFAVVGDERKDIVIAQLSDRHGVSLPRFLELCAFHGTTAVQDDREIHPRTPGIVAFARFDFDLHDHFARTEPVNVIALGRDSQSQIRRG